MFYLFPVTEVLQCLNKKYLHTFNFKTVDFVTSHRQNYGHTDDVQLITGEGGPRHKDLGRTTGAQQISWKTSLFSH